MQKKLNPFKTYKKRHWSMGQWRFLISLIQRLLLLRMLR